MARYRDSRSPSPAGSQHSSSAQAHHRIKDDDRRGPTIPRGRRDGGGGGGGGGGFGRDRRRRSRTPPADDVRRRFRENGNGGGHSAADRYDNEQRRYRDRDRGDRDRDRDRDSFRARDRSLDRRDGDVYRGGDRRPPPPSGRGDRGRSRDRDRSPPRRDRSRDRDRDRDYRARRDDSRDRGGGSRREGTADSYSRSKRYDSPQRNGRGGSPRGRSRERSSEVCVAHSRNRAHGDVHAETKTQADKSKPAPAPAQPTEAEIKAERLAKLEAWKKKLATKSQAAKETTSASATRKLLAEMDEKAGKSPVATPDLGAPSGAGSPATSNGTPGGASPMLPYAGKFDPKAIARKAAPRGHSPDRLGGGLGMRVPDGSTATFESKTTVSALPQGRANLSGFGFNKQAAGNDKAPQKRKLMLDEEETSKRKLHKLPAFSLKDADEDASAVPNADEDEEEEDGHFAGNEEESAAEARKAMERRDERIKQQQTQQQQTENEQAEELPDAPPEEDHAAASVAKEPSPAPEPMQVDEEEEVDPLDAFMSELVGSETAGKTKKKTTTAAAAQDGKQDQEPEAYFSGDEYDYAENSAEPDSILAMAAKARRKKDIPTIDYKKLDLPPVRKNFWHTPDEFKDLTEEDIAELRMELDGIRVSGKNVPPPVQKWSQCGMPRQTMDVINALGFEKPTPIQMQALPAIMSGRDVVGVAKTGSGKTLAFLLPMFRHIKDQEPLKDTDGPIGLVMAPTRELATQIHRDCKPFLKALGLRAVCAYGGPPIRDHIADLKRGAEIVVCTPGRLIDLLAANQGRVTNLRRVTFVVLDEADRMFDMGFEPQVMKVFNNMRPDRQTILFSATMPKIIDALTKRVLNNPIEITVGGKSVVAPEITQIVEVRAEKDKFIRVLELLGNLYDTDEDARTLIFVERQEKADELLKELMQKGYPCMSIHGGKDQLDRDSTIQDFKNGVVPIVIATSVAARGLDIKQLKLVINYDAPNHLEDYVHRAGRTGRAGNTGTAVTFVTPEQENCAAPIAKALEQSGQPVPEQIDAMRKAHREKVKAGKAKDSSGFGGKGLERLDKERDAARQRERKAHKAEGEEDEEDDKPKHDDRTQKAASAVQSAASAIVSRDAARADPAKLAAAKAAELAAAQADPNNPLAKVSSAIDLINARLGRTGTQPRAGQSLDNKGPDAGAYHATLEINDFPQKARWAVTNRTNVAKILDSTGTSITTKGTFYPPGKEVPPGGDPKLYILVEGDTELVVANAMAELKRLLREGTLAAADAEIRAPIGGRYTVT